MNKQKSIIVGLLLISIMLSGCLGYNSRPPPGYPPKYNVGDINIELKYEYPIFYFGDVVQDNGSVNQSKTINWTLTINNHGNYTEDVRFELLQFPEELMIWSTELKIFEIHTVEVWAEEEKEAFNMTYTLERTLEYDYYNREFDRLWIEGVPVNASIEFVVSITFNETVAWSYSPDTTYVGFFEIGKRTCNPECRNIHYEEEIIPFVVRT